MSITVRGEPKGRLRITGDLEASLPVPFDDAGERFHLSFSDGTLAQGMLDAGAGTYQFRTAVEGAGVSRIARDGPDDVRILDWRVEWATIAASENGLRRDERPDLSQPERPLRVAA